jgi:hypothetical protein
MGRVPSTNGAKRNAHRILVGKPEGKRTLGRPTRRWVNNIKMDLGDIGWGGMDWIALSQDRDQWRALVNTVMILRVRFSCYCIQMQYILTASLHTTLRHYYSGLMSRVY